jgi:hypothetical protein
MVAALQRVEQPVCYIRFHELLIQVLFMRPPPRRHADLRGRCSIELPRDPRERARRPVLPPVGRLRDRREGVLCPGCLDIPVHGEQEPFSWGVWVSLSETSFRRFSGSFHQAKRSHVGPFSGGWPPGWTGTPKVLNLKTRVHLRDDGIRPSIELEPTEHPLAIEQREGISVERLGEIYAMMMNDEGPHRAG